MARGIYSLTHLLILWLKVGSSNKCGELWWVVTRVVMMKSESWGSRSRRIIRMRWDGQVWQEGECGVISTTCKKSTHLYWERWNSEKWSCRKTNKYCTVISSPDCCVCWFLVIRCTWVSVREVWSFYRELTGGSSFWSLWGLKAMAIGGFKHGY